MSCPRGEDGSSKMIVTGCRLGQKDGKMKSSQCMSVRVGGVSELEMYIQGADDEE